MTISQIAPIDLKATTRRSSDNVWPLRGIDGKTFAERKADELAEPDCEQCGGSGEETYYVGGPYGSYSCNGANMRVCTECYGTGKG